VSSQGASPAIDASDVRERLGFARRRADDLIGLDDLDNPFATEASRERQQVTQEFFFHLVGAVEIVAQLVNTTKALGLDVQQVSVPAVCKELGASDPVTATISRLYVNPRRRPMPADPYGDAGTIYRIYNHRGQVTHRRRNPTTFKLTLGAGDDRAVAHFTLDPRDLHSGASTRTIREDVEAMYAYVHDGCEAVLALL
jgi:hypothetical protein